MPHGARGEKGPSTAEPADEPGQVAKSPDASVKDMEAKIFRKMAGPQYSVSI
jgi:hypothetical protein